MNSHTGTETRSRLLREAAVGLFILSDQLPVFALVSRYLTNKLMGRRFILRRKLL